MPLVGFQKCHRTTIKTGRSLWSQLSCVSLPRFDLPGGGFP